MSEKKSFLDSVAEETTKPESFNEEKFEYVNGGNKKKIIIISSIALLIVAAVFIVTYITSRVTVPDMVGWDINNSYQWAQNNKITLNINNEFDFDIDEDIVIAQNLEAEETIKKNSVLNLTVSMGADPDESMEFPNIEEMNNSEIEAWIEENKLTGAQIETQYSDVVEADKVINYELLDGNEENFKRKSRVTIYISEGSQELAETIIVPSFANTTAAQVIQWGSENDIEINIVEVFDEYANAGLVVTQSVNSGTEMLRVDGLTVEVSKGKAVTIANLTSMTKSEAQTWANQNNVSLVINDRYNNSYAQGKLYSQSIASGTSTTEGEIIKINCSLGKVEVGNFVGGTKLDILTWKDDVNENGANISIAENQEYGEAGSFGKIISQSISNDTVNTSTEITITISKGMKLIMPDLAGKTEEEVRSLGDELGIKILFDYKYSELSNPEDAESEPTVSRDYVISQSILADTIISDADTINVVISLGKEN